MNGDDEKSFPAGLVKIYGEDILGTVRGCEFHLRDSANRKAKLSGELKEKFVTEAFSLLTDTTPETYHAARHHFKFFLNNEAPSVDVSTWLDWCHDRRKFIFRAFTLKEFPSSNLAEVIHAGWKNRDRIVR